MNLKKTKTIRPIYRQNVIKTLLKYGPISRIDIANKLSISKATVSSIILELLESNLIIESSIAASTGGRKAILYDMNASSGYIISLEITPTYLSASLLDLHVNVISDLVVEMNTDYTESLTLIIEHIETLKQQIPKGSSLIGISLNFRGTISKDNVIKYFDYDTWKGQNIKQDLETHYDCLINCHNEANSRAYYNSVHLGNSDLTLLTMGTGVGLGIIENNKINLGNNGYAGEIGHIIVNPQGPPCPCGNHGCLESYISTIQILNRLSEIKNEPITLEDFKRYYDLHDFDTLEIIQDFFNYLAIATNNIINIFNPKYMILSSDIIDHIPNFMDSFKEHLHSKVSDYEKLIVFSKKRAGAIGGAYLLLEDYLNIEYYIQNQNRLQQ